MIRLQVLLLSETANGMAGVRRRQPSGKRIHGCMIIGAVEQQR